MNKWELGELQHLSRSADHLGSLANVLKDLGGDETILHELAQNADDAESATKIRFSVDADALTVWNDGVFSNCGDQEQKLCRWRHEHGRSCDLHAFRLFSGRHKSGDASTTGAFGVGFTCVYHLTDHPELITAGTHLLLDESASEDQRIKVCLLDNCSRAHEASGTTFVLPWAKRQSVLRQQLDVETVDDDRIARLDAAFRRDAAATILFLKRVSTIDLSLGPSTLTVHREVDDDIVRVIAGKRCPRMPGPRWRVRHIRRTQGPIPRYRSRSECRRRSGDSGWRRHFRSLLCRAAIPNANRVGRTHQWQLLPADRPQVLRVRRRHVPVGVEPRPTRLSGPSCSAES